MSIIDTAKQYASKLKSPLMEYAEFNEAYEEAFDQERPEYTHEIDEDVSNEEFLDWLGNQLRYTGDAFRASEDEDIQELTETISDYVGGGKKGNLFRTLAEEEEYETAAKLFGLDEEQVEKDIAPVVDQYKQIRTERYGEKVKNDSTDEFLETTGHIAEVVHPVTRAYQNNASKEELIDSMVEVGKNIDKYLSSEDTAPSDVDPIDIREIIDELDEEEK